MKELVSPESNWQANLLSSMTIKSLAQNKVLSENSTLQKSLIQHAGAIVEDSALLWMSLERSTLSSSSASDSIELPVDSHAAFAFRL
jgi:hypothetical protein